MSALTLIQNASNVSNQKSLLKSFISRFTSDEFFSDIISLALFPADFGNSGSLMKSDTIVTYINTFLKDIRETVKRYNFPNQTQINKQSNLVSSILTIRESSPSILSYDTVFKVVSTDLAGKKIINTAIQNKILNLEIFKDQLSNIINIINSYHEIKSISSNLLLYDTLVDSVESGNQNIFESIKSYRDLVINSYNDLSKLQILNKIEKTSDYYILKNKEETTQHLSRSLVDYISDSYSFFKTGYELFDNFVDGFESASIHIVSAPSNHGKSIFLINLLRNLIVNNTSEFEENDAILLVTLEDNIPKVVRRISSIFGNYSHTAIKSLYRESSEKINQIKKSNGDLRSIKENISHIFSNILTNAIKNTTNSNINLVIKYCSENTFSPGDLSKFVDQLKVTDKLNTKLIILDYIDCARPTMEGFKIGDDYSNQGQIVHELRKLTVNLDIPILTATQNSRTSENLNGEMTNALVGDSYKKVRYTDYLYMSRMCNNRTFLDNDVSRDVCTEEQRTSTKPRDIAIRDELSKILIPYEVKITKAKEGIKDKSKYMLFCCENLRIYDNIEQYLRDRKQLKSNTKNLEQQVIEMGQYQEIINPFVF